jgi:hypothetical protein
MSELQVLAAIRSYLLEEKAAPHVHLDLPPNAAYPLVLLELEEIWSSFGTSGKGIQARVKFKVSVYARMPHRQEMALISDKIKHALEGVNLKLPENKGATLRFLACVAEAPPDKGQPLATHHFYDAIISGERR